MATISLRVSEEESKLIKEYIEINGLNMSSFIRDAIIEKIEEDLNLDTERIKNALLLKEKEAAYDHQEVWDRLGV